MKTLPYLKQITYAAIIVTFPFIFSASRDTALPEPVVQPVRKTNILETPNPEQTIKTIRTTVDSVKNSSRMMIYQALN
ncbi:hypothetical protein [Pedobacter sp.]|uniref:hypothetical protein n=1 Tax=Pedobacter sp. TaxID=1411316 RepID=UPI003D7F4ED1